MRLYPEDKVEAFLADGWWSGKTWLDLVAGHVAERPDRLSLVDPANREAITDGAPRRYTWAEVGDEIDSLARSLYRAGVRQGDVVGVQLPNIAELNFAYLALASLGAITCSFPVQYAAHELTQMGTLAGLSTFVTVGRVNRSHPPDRPSDCSRRCRRCAPCSPGVPTCPTGWSPLDTTPPTPTATRSSAPTGTVWRSTPTTA